MATTIIVNSNMDTLILPPNKAKGRSEHVIYQLPEESLNRHVKTPTRMIKMDGLLSSTITNFTDHSTLHHIDYGLTLETNPDTSSGLKGTAANKLSDIVVIIANDTYIPSLITKLTLRQIIAEVSIKYLHWTGGDQAPAILEEVKFGNVIVSEHHTGTFSSLFVLRPEEFLMKWQAFKQEDASAQGVNQVSFNYKTNSSSVTISPSEGPTTGGGAGGGGEAAPPAAPPPPPAAPPPPPPPPPE